MDYTSNFNFIWLFFFVFRRGKRLKHFFTLYIQNINIYNTLFSHWHAFYTLITHMGPINTYIKYTYTQTHMNSYTRLYNIFFIALSNYDQVVEWYFCTNQSIYEYFSHFCIKYTKRNEPKYLFGTKWTNNIFFIAYCKT